jgi:hypothetical protein
MSSALEAGAVFAGREAPGFSGTRVQAAAGGDGAEVAGGSTEGEPDVSAGLTVLGS